MSQEIMAWLSNHAAHFSALGLLLSLASLLLLLVEQVYMARRTGLPRQKPTPSRLTSSERSETETSSPATTSTTTPTKSWTDDYETLSWILGSLRRKWRPRIEAAQADLERHKKERKQEPPDTHHGAGAA